MGQRSSFREAFHPAVVVPAAGQQRLSLLNAAEEDRWRAACCPVQPAALLRHQLVVGERRAKVIMHID